MFCLFDTEGRGYRDANVPSLLDVAFIKVDDNCKEVDRFHTLVNPRASISSLVSGIHNISQNTVADAPLFSDVTGDLLSFIGDLPLVAFNAKADRALLNHDLHVCNCEPLPYERFFCAERIARKLYKQDFSADRLAEYLGVPTRDGFHGALIDTEMLYHCFAIMMKHEDFSWSFGKTQPRVPKVHEWKTWIDKGVVSVLNTVSNEVFVTEIVYPEDHLAICSGKMVKILPPGQSRPFNPIGPDLIFFNGKEFETRKLPPV